LSYGKFSEIALKQDCCQQKNVKHMTNYYTKL